MVVRHVEDVQNDVKIEEMRVSSQEDQSLGVLLALIGEDESCEGRHIGLWNPRQRLLWWFGMSPNYLSMACQRTRVSDVGQPITNVCF